MGEAILLEIKLDVYKGRKRSGWTVKQIELHSIYTWATWSREGCGSCERWTRRDHSFDILARNWQSQLAKLKCNTRKETLLRQSLGNGRLREEEGKKVVKQKETIWERLTRLKAKKESTLTGIGSRPLMDIKTCGQERKGAYKHEFSEGMNMNGKGKDAHWIKLDLS